MHMMGGYASQLETSYLILHLTLYSPKPQESVRQWRPFANDKWQMSKKARNDKYGK